MRWKTCPRKVTLKTRINTSASLRQVLHKQLFTDFTNCYCCCCCCCCCYYRCCCCCVWLFGWLFGCVIVVLSRGVLLSICFCLSLLSLMRCYHRQFCYRSRCDFSSGYNFRVLFAIIIRSVTVIVIVVVVLVLFCISVCCCYRYFSRGCPCSICRCRIVAPFRLSFSSCSILVMRA